MEIYLCLPRARVQGGFVNFGGPLQLWCLPSWPWVGAQLPESLAEVTGGSPWRFPVLYLRQFYHVSDLEFWNLKGFLGACSLPVQAENCLENEVGNWLDVVWHEKFGGVGCNHNARWHCARGNCRASRGRDCKFQPWNTGSGVIIHARSSFLVETFIFSVLELCVCFPHVWLNVLIPVTALYGWPRSPLPVVQTSELKVRHLR